MPGRWSIPANWKCFNLTGMTSIKPHDDEAYYARFPLSSSLPQVGERGKVSLREFHDSLSRRKKWQRFW